MPKGSNIKTSKVVPVLSGVFYNNPRHRGSISTILFGLITRYIKWFSWIDWVSVGENPALSYPWQQVLMPKGCHSDARDDGEHTPSIPALAGKVVDIYVLYIW